MTLFRSSRGREPAAAERNRNMVTARLIECPEPVQLPAFDERDAESTSAALRRVEQERDQALAERDEFVAAADKLNDSWLGLKAELATARTAYLAQAAELVSARIELDAVRTVRDNLDRELADAYNTIRALVGLPVTRRTEESETT